VRILCNTSSFLPLRGSHFREKMPPVATEMANGRHSKVRQLQQLIER
jgi:hypothetical protein